MKHIGLYLKKKDAKGYGGVRQIGKYYAVPFARKPLGGDEDGLIPLLIEDEDWEKLPLIGIIP